ncbi:MAG: lysophospholipid acyltransferase family protein [Bacilli bacterium]|nr:lysophospholipid acyltransferase family protein [Bacilli bacterium]
MRNPFLYKVVKPLILLWFIPRYRPRYMNRENIPKKGRVILAGTHVSKLDGFMLGSSTRRPVRFIAKKELFKGIGKWFFTACGLVPVDRRNHDDNVMLDVTNLLEKEALIGIFPEGTVNKTNKIIAPFKTGAVRMAILTKSPIVPFAIIGKYEKYKKNVKIIFGELYYPKTDDVIKENKELEKKVKNIIKKESFH